jgi:hypothetical protein
VNDEKTSSGAPAPRLFPEAGPPELIVVGWRQFLGLPGSAKQNIWALLEQALEHPDHPDNPKHLQAYAERFQANVSNVLGAVRACDWVLRQAAAAQVPEEAFREDLLALSPEDPSGVEVMLSRYAATQNWLRAKILEDTLADHGNVLTGFDWRIDRVDVSGRGNLGGTGVVYLRLQYRNADGEHGLSVQVTAEMMDMLRGFCERVTVERS